MITRVMAALVLVALLGGTNPSFAGDAWELLYEDDGITVDRRYVPEAKIYELRARASSKLPRQLLLDSVWKHSENTVWRSHLTTSQILRSAEDEYVVYERVSYPLAKPRDYSARLRLLRDSQTGVDQIMVTRETEGPPESLDAVRITRLNMSWTFEPSDDGGELVTFTLLIDPAGLLPRWLVNFAQKKAPFHTLSSMLDHAEKKAKAGPR